VTLEATTPLEGTLRFIRYAFMPNRLRYCGGDDNRTLFEYGVEGVTDGGLQPLLRKFNGALPYLQLIARSNGLPDPFDARVVEAYWIGNELLDGVEARELYASLQDRFASQLTARTRELVLGKAPAGAHPHHSFHVLDVYSRVGELDATLAVLDNCRIGWARVVSVTGAELSVERQALVLVAGKLALGEPRAESLLRQVDGHGFVDQAAVGDWVSTHWGWACEVLDERQRRNLEQYTHHHLRIANQTL
jgi:hydrogenase maturation factor